MVSSEEDRCTILHRLLCCLWNGQVDIVDGDPASPERVRLRLFREEGAHVPGVRLRLGDYPGGVSSWAELLRSYERWSVLDDEQIVEEYCSVLMTRAQPLGLATTGSEPHPLFVDLVEKIAPRQLDLLAERRRRGGGRVEGWVRPLWEFWAETLPAALDMEFGDQRAVQPTLRTLLDHVRGGTPRGPRMRDDGPGPRRSAADDDDWGTAPVSSFDSYRRGGARDEPTDDNGDGSRYGDERRYEDDGGYADDRRYENDGRYADGRRYADTPRYADGPYEDDSDDEDGDDRRFGGDRPPREDAPPPPWTEDRDRTARRGDDGHGRARRSSWEGEHE
jgi:hypothetical protein